MNGASQQKFNQGTKADNKKIEEIAYPDFIGIARKIYERTKNI